MNYDTSIHTNPDAMAWAKFFMQTKAENPDLVIDEALMVGWFANAMMAMHDHLQGGGPINGDHAEHLLASGAAPKPNRKAFEAWAEPILGDNPTWKESADCELAWQAWNAAQKETDR
jgi:hypothetical protein